MEFSVRFILLTVFFNNFYMNNCGTVRNVSAKNVLEKILGGNETKLGEFKYVVAVLFIEASCTGAIISDNYILSSGHCFVKEDGEFENESASILAGTNEITDSDIPTMVEIQVEKVYVPANYYRKRGWTIKLSLPPHDIAVLKLATSLNISGNPNLEALFLPPKRSRATYVDMPATVAGFGDNEVTEESKHLKRKEFTSDYKLHWANAVVVSNSNCQGKHYNKVDEAQMCAQMKTNSSEIFGTCNGDSGAPLVFTSSRGTNILIGLQAGHRACNEARHPALYTRITSHVEFIELVVQGKANSSIAREITLPIGDQTDDDLPDDK